jgi:hypothetical protein
MDNLYHIEVRDHHVIVHFLYYGETWIELWLTPQQAANFHADFGASLERVPNIAEGRMYAGDLFTYEIGQAMTQTGVRVVDVGEVEA